MNRRSTLFLLIGIIGLLLGSCLSMGPVSPNPDLAAPAIFPVDSTFKEFYHTLGDQDVLGQPITGPIDLDGKKCQYTEAAEMCFDRNEPDESQRFSLSPLGLDLQVRETPEYLANAQQGKRDLGNGFVLYDEFTSLYDRIYGALYAGQPLTQVRVNHGLQRYEQFFENIGFYRRFTDPVGEARLITYGSYLCGPDCSRNLNEYWQIIQTGMIPQPFELSVERLGWRDLGSPLTQPVLTNDGNLEQVYDNVVLTAPVNDLSQVRFKPIVLALGVVQPQAPLEKNPHDQLVFYEIENGLGHNVPLFFDEFIAMHGGMDLSGNPLTELFPQEDGKTFRQCFENYCLDYDPLAPDAIQVRMAPLGLQYADASEPGKVLRRAFSPETVDLKIEESKPMLGSEEQQQLTVHVFHHDTHEPMFLVESEVLINLPDGSSETYHIKPTDRDGAATLTLPVLTDLPNLSVVEYQVCLNLPGDPKICAADSFIFQVH